MSSVGDAGANSDDEASEDTATPWWRRGPILAVLAVMSLAVVALYIGLGGPLPFLVDGSPALESVPEEADAVVYTDAWTFSSETSRGVADGLLAATNRSLPGYTGPASLDDAFEALQSTDLDPTGLRSMTAFAAYDDDGQPSAYQAMILRTGWGRQDLLSAFGGNASGYEQQTVDETTVFVHGNESVQFPWIAELDGETYVMGNESAVNDAIEATTGSGDGMDADLESGFRSLRDGPIRFAATMPERIPGQALAPASVTDTIAAIDTVGGVYYPDGDSATVELEVRTADADTAEEIEPAVRDAITFARDNAPNDTRDLLGGASVSRADTMVSVSLSGAPDSFVEGYQAFLNSGPVRLLLGQPVGTPALEYVPADADLVAYGDASIVADPTTLRVANALASNQALAGEVSLGDAIDQLQQVSTLDLTAFRSTTVFARGVSPDANTTDSTVIVEADWSEQAIAQTLDNSSLAYERETVNGVPVLQFEAQGSPIWLAILDDTHQAIGTPTAVADVIDVSTDSAPALDGEIRTAFERLPRGYLSLATRLPSGLDDGGLPGAQFVSEVQVFGLSYESTPAEVRVQGQIHLETASGARDARNAIDGLKNILTIQSSNQRVRDFLNSIRVTRNDTVVTGTARTRPRTVVGVAEWLVNTTSEQDTGTVVSIGPADEQAALPPVSSPTSIETRPRAVEVQR